MEMKCKGYVANQQGGVIYADVPMTTDQVRDLRNRALRDSDFSQLEDAPTDKQAWKVYRQALRDITKQPGFPLNVDWPTPPTT